MNSTLHLPNPIIINQINIAQNPHHTSSYNILSTSHNNRIIPNNTKSPNNK